MFGVVMGAKARHAAREDRSAREATGGAAPAEEPGEPGEDQVTGHQCALTFAALPSTPRWARALARQALRGWELEPLAETVELLVSELVTNAVKVSGRETVIRVAIRTEEDRLRIEVTDGADGKPHVDDPGPDRESGRGLLLVSEISAEWGTYPVRVGSGPASGKVVWCEIPVAG